MRKTFNTIRQKVNNMFPYIVTIDGEIGYLFEVDKNIGLRQIICIHKAFKGTNLMFATPNFDLINSTCVRDAADVYCRIYVTPVFYYDGNKFFHIVESKRDGEFIDMALSKKEASVKFVRDKKQLLDLLL